jgi:hypothetical protein
MTSISDLSLRISVWSLTLIGIARKGKKILTYTQETIRAKLERLHSARLIHYHQKITTRHAKALTKLMNS